MSARFYYIMQCNFGNVTSLQSAGLPGPNKLAFGVIHLSLEIEHLKDFMQRGIR